MVYSYRNYTAYVENGMISIWGNFTRQEHLRKKIPEMIGSLELYIQLEIDNFISECRTYFSNYQNNILRSLLTSKQYSEYCKGN